MAMGQQQDRRGDLMVGWVEMARSPGHVFYDGLQSVLIEGGFDGFAEATCKPYYATRLGAPSVPPGCYFRIHHSRRWIRHRRWLIRPNMRHRQRVSFTGGLEGPGRQSLEDPDQ